MPKKTLLGAFMLLLLATPAKADECRAGHPEWYRCVADADCVLIYNPCGWPTEAAASAFAEEAKTCNRHVGTALSCAEYDAAKSGTFTPQCQAGVCVAVKLKLNP